MSQNAQLIDDLRYLSENSDDSYLRYLHFSNLRIVAASLIGAGL